MIDRFEQLERISLKDRLDRINKKCDFGKKRLNKMPTREYKKHNHFYNEAPKLSKRCICKPVVAQNIETKEIYWFESAVKTAYQLCRDKDIIYKSIKNHPKPVNGFVLRWATPKEGACVRCGGYVIGKNNIPEFCGYCRKHL